MKLKEIAEKINAHLKRIEAKQDKTAQNKWCSAGAGQSGSKVFVVYVSYQGKTCLTTREAEAYLAWLDAGNAGPHYQAVKNLPPLIGKQTTLWTVHNNKTVSTQAEERNSTYSLVPSYPFSYRTTLFKKDMDLIATTKDEAIRLYVARCKQIFCALESQKESAAKALKSACDLADKEGVQLP